MRQKNDKKKGFPLRFYAVSLILAGIPLGLAVLFWLFALVVALVKAGWLVFYGSTIFLYALSVMMLPCGLAAVIHSLLAFRRQENHFRCTISIIAAFLTVALGALLASQMF